MRHLALALTFAACAPFVRASDLGDDAGTPTASVLDLNGALITPGIFTQIAPNGVVTSPKFYLRKDESVPPNCTYGVFLADPAVAPTAAGAGQPNNGVLISALGDMAAINSDSSQGGTTRSTCPTPSAYPVGGAIPDGVQVGDQLAITGYFEPYCDYYDTSLGQCAADLFPEFSPDSPGSGNPAGQITDLGPATAIPPVIVQASAISNLALNAIQYAGELVQVQNVTVSGQLTSEENEVILTGSELWIAPLVCTTCASYVAAAAGSEYCSITGNVHYTFGNWELRPRTQADLVAPVDDAGTCPTP